MIQERLKGTACGDGKERHHGIRCADCYFHESEYMGDHLRRESLLRIYRFCENCRYHFG